MGVGGASVFTSTFQFFGCGGVYFSFTES